MKISIGKKKIIPKIPEFILKNRSSVVNPPDPESGKIRPFILRKSGHSAGSGN
jgi:hypothetical protein